MKQPPLEKGKYYGNINVHLFNWVVENLMRNSLDSIDGNGKLFGTVKLDLRPSLLV